MSAIVPVLQIVENIDTPLGVTTVKPMRARKAVLPEKFHKQKIFAYWMISQLLVNNKIIDCDVYDIFHSTDSVDAQIAFHENFENNYKEIKVELDNLIKERTPHEGATQLAVKKPRKKSIKTLQEVVPNDGDEIIDQLVELANVRKPRSKKNLPEVVPGLKKANAIDAVIKAFPYSATNTLDGDEIANVVRKPRSKKNLPIMYFNKSLTE